MVTFGFSPVRSVPAAARLSPATKPLAKAGALAWLVIFLLLIPRAGWAQDALPFSRSYSVTGNYVVGGVDLRPGDRDDDDRPAMWTGHATKNTENNLCGFQGLCRQPRWKSPSLHNV